MAPVTLPRTCFLAASRPLSSASGFLGSTAKPPRWATTNHYLGKGYLAYHRPLITNSMYLVIVILTNKVTFSATKR